VQPYPSRSDAPQIAFTECETLSYSSGIFDDAAAFTVGYLLAYE
jgi:hypothetical protein